MFSIYYNIQTALEQPMISLTCTFEQVNLEKFTLVGILFHLLCPHEISEHPSRLNYVRHFCFLHSHFLLI